MITKVENKNEVILFVDNEIELEVPITPEQEAVWLTQEQMSVLFDTARSSIAYHIGKIFKEEELDKSTSVEIFDRSETHVCSNVFCTTYYVTCP